MRPAVKYRQGEGIDQGMARDIVRSHMWFSLLAAQGNAAAKRTLGMTPDELAESRRLAAEWTAQHGQAK